jgi:hypothetical protein
LADLGHSIAYSDLASHAVMLSIAASSSVLRIQPVAATFSRT